MWKEILISFIIIERRLEEVSSFMEQKLKGDKFKSPDIFQALGLQLVVWGTLEVFITGFQQKKY